MPLSVAQCRSRSCCSRHHGILVPHWHACPVQGQEYFYEVLGSEVTILQWSSESCASIAGEHHTAT